MLPTPPVAPVTSTSPDSLVRPLAIRRMMQSAAVSPAVPWLMLSLSDRPCGSFAAHSAGTLMYCAKPPEVFMPRSKPVTVT